MSSRRQISRSYSADGRSSYYNGEDVTGNIRSSSRSYLSSVRPENSRFTYRYSETRPRSTLCTVMAQLTEETQPSFEITLKSKAVSEACNVKFICVLTGHPAPEVTWYKDDIQLDRYCGLPKYEISKDERTHSLHIYNCTLEDAAIYQASARNSKGIVSCSGVLEVGTMSEYKIHQQYFAKIKQKAENKRREPEEPKPWNKENNKPSHHEQMRSISPDRSQRKRRSPMEESFRAPNSLEDMGVEQNSNVPALQVEACLHETTMVEKEKPRPDTKGASPIPNGEAVKESDTKGLTYIYDSVQKTSTKHQPKPPLAKKKIKVLNGNESLGADHPAENLNEEREEREGASVVQEPTQTLTLKASQKEFMEVESAVLSQVSPRETLTKQVQEKESDDGDLESFETPWEGSAALPQHPWELSGDQLSGTETSPSLKNVSVSRLPLLAETQAQEKRNDAPVTLESQTTKCELDVKSRQQPSSDKKVVTDANKTPSLPNPEPLAHDKMMQNTQDHSRGSNESHTVPFTDLQKSPLKSLGDSESTSRYNVSPTVQQSQVETAIKSVEGTEIQVDKKVQGNGACELQEQGKNVASLRVVEMATRSEVQQTNTETAVDNTATKTIGIDTADVLDTEKEHHTMHGEQQPIMSISESMQTLEHAPQCVIRAETTEENVALIHQDSSKSSVKKHSTTESSTPLPNPDCNPELRQGDRTSPVPSATPQELAAGARRKIVPPKPKVEDSQATPMADSYPEREEKNKRSSKLSSEGPTMSPNLSCRSPSLQPPSGQHTPAVERRSPLLRRKLTPDTPTPSQDHAQLLDINEDKGKKAEKDKQNLFKAPQVIRKIRGEPFSDASGHLKLWCQFFNVLSESTVKWHRDEMEIAETKRSAGDETQVALAIVQATTKDCGVYGCTITNEYGTDSTDILLSVNILAEMFLREDQAVGEEIEMTPLLFNKVLADTFWGNKFFGRIMMEEAHIGEGCSHKTCRAKVIYGLEPVFESGTSVVIKVHNPIAYGGKEESTLVERNLDLTQQDCRYQNTAREYCKIFSAEAKMIENFGVSLEVIPLYLMNRPANAIPNATVEVDLKGVYLKYCFLDTAGRLIMRSCSELEQKCCAFQHWIHQWTNGNLLFTRLEGVDTKITNVGISIKTKGYQGFTGIGNPKVFEQFVSQHQCNFYCGLLSLRSLKDCLQTPARSKGSKSPHLHRKMAPGSSSPQAPKKVTGSPAMSRKAGPQDRSASAKENVADTPS
ncbi:alpha-protein kinase 3, partial [Aplochiton taeniatus]